MSMGCPARPDDTWATVAKPIFRTILSRSQHRPSRTIDGYTNQTRRTLRVGILRRRTGRCARPRRRPASQSRSGHPPGWTGKASPDDRGRASGTSTLLPIPDRLRVSAASHHAPRRAGTRRRRHPSGRQREVNAPTGLIHYRHRTVRSPRRRTRRPRTLNPPPVGPRRATHAGHRCPPPRHDQGNPARPTDRTRSSWRQT